MGDLFLYALLVGKHFESPGVGGLRCRVFFWGELDAVLTQQKHAVFRASSISGSVLVDADLPSRRTRRHDSPS